jgi:excisionase family DNA binding protein
MPRSANPPASPRADSVPAAADDDCTTVEVAALLGLAVRSVQLMVDRGELQAWKTPGGHRRISRRSVDRWVAARRAVAEERVEPAARAAPAQAPASEAPAIPAPPAAQRRAEAGAATVLLIEDSRHFQNLVSLLVRQHFPEVELQVADDGIAGLALAGRLQPAVLLVDILLPGIDGATLINGLRSHPAFAPSRLIVITSLEGAALEPYAFALAGVPVVHKPRLVLELPALLRAALESRAPHAGA